MGKTFADLSIAATGSFGEGKESSAIKRWVENAGGTFTSSVTAETTHLICTKEHWKLKPALVQAATKHGVEIVSFDWVEDSLASRRPRVEKPYRWAKAAQIKKKARVEKKAKERKTANRLAKKFEASCDQAGEDLHSGTSQKKKIKEQKPLPSASPSASEAEDSHTHTQPLDSRAALAQLRQARAAQAAAELAQEKKREVKTARADLALDRTSSENHHYYRDPSGFVYSVTLSRADIAHNTSERYRLTLYESHAAPHTYATHVRFFGAADQETSQVAAAVGSDFATAFAQFRKVFKRNCRVSWEERGTERRVLVRRLEEERARVMEMSRARGQTVDERDHPRIRPFVYMQPVEGRPRGVGVQELDGVDARQMLPRGMAEEQVGPAMPAMQTEHLITPEDSQRLEEQCAVAQPCAGQEERYMPEQMDVGNDGGDAARTAVYEHQNREDDYSNVTPAVDTLEPHQPDEDTEMTTNDSMHDDGTLPQNHGEQHQNHEDDYSDAAPVADTVLETHQRDEDTEMATDTTVHEDSSLPQDHHIEHQQAMPMAGTCITPADSMSPDVSMHAEDTEVQDDTSCFGNGNGNGVVAEYDELPEDQKLSIFFPGEAQRPTYNAPCADDEMSRGLHIVGSGTVPDDDMDMEETHPQDQDDTLTETCTALESTAFSGAQKHEDMSFSSNDECQVQYQLPEHENQNQEHDGEVAGPFTISDNDNDNASANKKDNYIDTNDDGTARYPAYHPPAITHGTSQQSHPRTPDNPTITLPKEDTEKDALSVSGSSVAVGSPRPVGYAEQRGGEERDEPKPKPEPLPMPEPETEQGQEQEREQESEQEHGPEQEREQEEKREQGQEPVPVPVSEREQAQEGTETQMQDQPQTQMQQQPLPDPSTPQAASPVEDEDLEKEVMSTNEPQTQVQQQLLPAPSAFQAASPVEDKDQEKDGMSTNEPQTQVQHPHPHLHPHQRSRSPHEVSYTPATTTGIEDQNRDKDSMGPDGFTARMGTEVGMGVAEAEAEAETQGLDGMEWAGNGDGDGQDGVVGMEWSGARTGNSDGDIDGDDDADADAEVMDYGVGGFVERERDEEAEDEVGLFVDGEEADGGDEDEEVSEEE